MQHLIDARAYISADLEITNVAFDKCEARPLIRRDEASNVLEVVTVTRGEIIQSNDTLIELEQGLQQVRADETGDAGNQPQTWRFAKRCADDFIFGHVVRGAGRLDRAAGHI